MRFSPPHRCKSTIRCTFRHFCNVTSPHNVPKSIPTISASLRMVSTLFPSPPLVATGHEGHSEYLSSVSQVLSVCIDSPWSAHVVPHAAAFPGLLFSLSTTYIYTFQIPLDRSTIHHHLGVNFTPTPPAVALLSTVRQNAFHQLLTAPSVPRGGTRRLFRGCYPLKGRRAPPGHGRVLYRTGKAHCSQRWIRQWLAILDRATGAFVRRLVQRWRRRHQPPPHTLHKSSAACEFSRGSRSGNTSTRQCISTWCTICCP